MKLPQNRAELTQLLNNRYHRYAGASFLSDDPILIPHRFTKTEDIEISALLTATIAWGTRKSIIGSMNRLMAIMDNSPFEFVINFSENDEKRLNGFAHRTFNSSDCIAFIRSLQRIYADGGGLKAIFTNGFRQTRTAKQALEAFRLRLIQENFSSHALKHVPNVEPGSAAKRLNMFLRWMVRPPKEGIDFGLWSEMPTSALLIPLDVHSGRVARALGLLTRKQNDFKAVEELTESLRGFDADDPVKYDFALFGMGVHGEI